MEIPFIIRQGGGATFSAKFAAPCKYPCGLKNFIFGRNSQGMVKRFSTRTSLKKPPGHRAASPHTFFFTFYYPMDTFTTSLKNFVFRGKSATNFTRLYYQNLSKYTSRRA